MSNLQESYVNQLEVARQESIDSKLKYSKAIQDYLIYKISDEVIIDFIGEHLLLSLMAIHAIDNNDYFVGTNGPDGSSIDPSFKLEGVLSSTLKKMIKEGSSLENEVDLLAKSLDHFMEYTDIFTMYNLGESIRLKDNVWADLFYSEVDYLDEWTYEESYYINQDYDHFYLRMKKVMDLNLDKILKGLLSGKYKGLYDLISENDTNDELFHKAGISRYGSQNDVEKIEEIIELYIKEILKGRKSSL